jgi:hypothetical protein
MGKRTPIHGIRRGRILSTRPQRTELQRVSRHRRWLRGPADRFLHYDERRRQHDGHGSVRRWALDNNSLLIVHTESSRDDRGWRGDSGSSVEHSTGERIHALATTENLYGLTPFGETAGAGARLHFRDTFDGRLQLRGRVFGISDTTSCALEDGLAVGPQDIVTAESSRCEETNPGSGAATTAFLFTLSSSLA